jgi:acyl transferase domain-containing protein
VGVGILTRLWGALATGPSREGVLQLMSIAAHNPSEGARPRDVAIIGMACVMPGASDVEAFWSNIVDGIDSVTEVPASRWNVDIHYDPDFEGPAKTPSGKEHKSVSKWGGFIPDVGFDALKWGIPPASLAAIDPAQLMALKAAGAALEDAGYGWDDRPFDRERASTVWATGSGGAIDLSAGHLLRLLLASHGVAEIPPELDAFLPEMTEDGLPGVLTSVIAGRVANRLDLGGKNTTVDSACASVLVALDIACDYLNAGSSDVVLLGGVDLHNGAQDYLSFTAAQALSRRGRCYSFDASGDGMTLSEGAGCVVLKRVADAVRDGDRIYCVVKGIGGSSDGRHLGLTAPRQEGQVKAVRRAYADAGMSPTEVGLVEAHGTGTVAGDRTELLTTTEVFGEAGVAPGTVVIGSVKSNIGHIKCASGMAALIKAAKATYHGVLPATLHISEPNHIWDPETSPFVFRDHSAPWFDERRVTAVSGFGFGGTNFHAILENHRPEGAPAVPAVGRSHWPAELLLFRAATHADLDARLAELSGRLTADFEATLQADLHRLRDIAASVSGAAPDQPVRLAIVATDERDLAAKVAAARAGQAVAGVYRATAVPAAPPAVAFLVPGAGAARPGMAGDVLVAFPQLRELAVSGRSLVDVMLPHQTFGERADQQAAVLAAVAEPAVAVAGITTAHALAAFGVQPAYLAGRNRLLGGDPAAQNGAEATGRPEPTDAELIAQIRGLADAGIGVFVEVGPGQGLTALVGQALAGRPHLAVATDLPDDIPGRGLVGLLHALGQLAAAGVPVDVGAVLAARDARPERWDSPARRAGWIVNGACARRADGSSLPKGLRPATEAPQFHVFGGPAPEPGTEAAARPAAGTAATAATNGNGHRAPERPPAVAANGAATTNGSGAATPSDADVTVVLEYLRILQEMIATGSEIVRGHVRTDGL